MKGVMTRLKTSSVSHPVCEDAGTNSVYPAPRKRKNKIRYVSAADKRYSFGALSEIQPLK
jgi:hypothetical protein